MSKDPGSTNDSAAERSSDPLNLVLGDLAAEGERLDTVVASLDEVGWRTPTPAPGWDVATQVAHLAWTDEVAVAAATDKQAWDALVVQALGDPEGFVDACALEGGRVPPGELLARWRASRVALAEALRTYPKGQRLPWFGPPMSPTSMATARFMETWAHALDVADALDVRLEQTDRIRHVAHLGVRTRNFSYSVHGLTPPEEEFRVRLVAPSGATWEWGPEEATQQVHGEALDFCRLVTRRAHPADLDVHAEGEDARAWLGIAQAFAGPPGPGRAQTSPGAENIEGAP